jgi:hypothetical protein
MTLPNWNPDDFLLDFEDIHYSGPIIDAPTTYKVMLVSKYIFTEVLKNAKIASMAEADLAALTLALVSIDYLSGYYSGKASNAKSYVAFLDAFFPEIYKKFNESIYYQLRCGLLHNLVAKNPYKKNQYEFILSNLAKNHLIDNGKGSVVFSVPIFIEDIRRAYAVYSYKLIMEPSQNQELIENFRIRFDKNMGASSVMINFPD